MLWHEEIRGRSAKDVASAYIKAISFCVENHIEFWAEKCFAQNKNWTLYTAFVCAVNSDWGPESISIKYLVKGHTFMGADAVHGNIGNKMKKASIILTYDDFVTLCKKASFKINPVQLQPSDFYDFESKIRSRQTGNLVLPELANICEARFEKGSEFLYYRLTFETEELTGTPFFKAKTNVKNFPNAGSSARGISGSKMPKFWAYWGNSSSKKEVLAWDSGKHLQI